MTAAGVVPPGCVACGGEAWPRASCSACGGEYHPRCLDPPLAALPDEGWVCSFCPSLRPRPSGARPADSSLTPSSSVAMEKRHSTSTVRAASTDLVSSILARLASVAHNEEALSRPTQDNDRFPAKGLLNVAAGDGDESKGGVRDMVGKVMGWAYESECEVHRVVCLVCEEVGARVTCEECGFAFHLGCLEPPLASVPDDGWACRMCAVHRRSRRRKSIVEIVAMEFPVARGGAPKKGPNCSMCLSRTGYVQCCQVCTAPFHPRCMDKPRDSRDKQGYTCADCHSPPTFDPALPVLIGRSSNSLAACNGDHHDCEAVPSVRAVETSKPKCQHRKRDESQSKKSPALAGNRAEGNPREPNKKMRSNLRKKTADSSASVTLVSVCTMETPKLEFQQRKKAENQAPRPAALTANPSDSSDGEPNVQKRKKSRKATGRPSTPVAPVSVPAVKTPKPECQQGKKEDRQSTKTAILAKNSADGSGTKPNEQKTRKTRRKETVGSSTSVEPSKPTRKSPRNKKTAAPPASIVPGQASTPDGVASSTLSDLPKILPEKSATDGDDEGVRRSPPADKRQPSTRISARCAAGMACNLAGGKLNECGECRNSYHSRCLSRPRTRSASFVWRCDECRENDLSSKPSTVR